MDKNQMFKNLDVDTSLVSLRDTSLLLSDSIYQDLANLNHSFKYSQSNLLQQIDQTKNQVSYGPQCQKCNEDFDLVRSKLELVQSSVSCLRNEVASLHETLKNSNKDEQIISLVETKLTELSLKLPLDIETIIKKTVNNAVIFKKSAQTSGTQKPLKAKSKSSLEQPMDESSVEAEMMEQQSDKPVKVKPSKKLKLKSKKNKSEDMEAAAADAQANNAATDSADSVQYECKHCNFLSNLTKNWHLNPNPFSSRKTKLNILFEQSVCLDKLMKLLKDMGTAVYKLKQFECENAIDCYESLPECQLNSSFVISQMAKAHFELHNYSKAEKLYVKLRRKYPYHLDGLEYYSTTLWHLQKEIALSSLAQELTEFDKLAAETWCVVGNCFSLHKEHDAAIKFFHRAAQVDPKFTYAYNLLSHEYVLIEEMDKGLSSFRKAIFLEPRHYDAWYGISMIHFKQEKFLLSEKYLKKALLINPHCSTLMVHIAVVYHSLKQSDKALQILERALAIEPKNTLCKFHRASILFSMEEYEKALEEYERLRRLILKESLIYYVISKMSIRLLYHCVIQACF